MTSGVRFENRFLTVAAQNGRIRAARIRVCENFGPSWAARSETCERTTSADRRKRLSHLALQSLPLCGCDPGLVGQAVSPAQGAGFLHRPVSKRYDAH